MTVRGTGLMKYRAGLEMEAEGQTGPAIARALGLKDAQTWYALKHTQRKKLDALNARAAEGAGENVVPDWALKAIAIMEAARTEVSPAGEELAQTRAEEIQSGTYLGQTGALNTENGIEQSVTRDAGGAQGQPYSAGKEVRMLKEISRTLRGSAYWYELEDEAVSITSAGLQPDQLHMLLRVKVWALPALIGELQEVVRILEERIA